MIAITTAIAAGRAAGWQGVGFAVPSSAVRLGPDSLQRHGRNVRPHLGVLVQQVTEELARELDLSLPEGVLMRKVPEGGQADRARIGAGDAIVAAVRMLSQSVDEVDVEDRIAFWLTTWGSE